MPKPKLWNIKTLTYGRKIIVQLEPREYGTSLIVVDKRHHYEGSRIAKVILRGPDVPKDIHEGDRLLIKGHAGKTLETPEHDYSGDYRVIRYSEIIAVIGEGLRVQV